MKRRSIASWQFTVLNLIFYAAVATAAPKMISVEGDVIKIDGKPISTSKKTKDGPRVTLSLKAAEAVVGVHERENNVSETKCFYYWDTCGMQMSERLEKVFSVYVSFGRLHFVPKKGESESEADNRRDLLKLNQTFDLKSDYEGSVTFNGLLIKKGTRLADIEPALQKQGFTFDRPHHEAELDRGHYGLYLHWQEDDGTLLGFSYGVSK